MINLILNGMKTIYHGKPDIKLLDFLRNDQNIKSVKDGCSGQSVCGACLVEINGKPKLSCSVKMEKLNNANIVTLEGMPEETKKVLGQAFVASGAVQCGFCSPGMLKRADMLLRKNPSPTRQEVIKAIKPNLCRCTGYIKIVDAIMLAAEKLKTKDEIEFENGKIGSSAPKYQGFERATGSPLFVDDLCFDNMIFGVLHFSEFPRAKVIKIDTSKAENFPGTVKVLSAKDVVGKRNTGILVKDWPLYVAENEITRCIGDVLACVVAKTEAIAREAAKLIQVEYQELIPLTNPEKSFKSDIKIHETGNVLKETVIKRGHDITEVFNRSKYHVTGTFQTQLIEHAFLETECSVSLYEQGKLTVYSQSQGIYEDRDQIADILGLSKKDVNIKLVPAGGAFGGKEDLTVQGHAALSAYHIKKPVKVKLNRSESLRMHPKRHPMKMEYQLSCDDHGLFTGLYARIIGDTGAYSSIGGPVMDRAATHAGGAYFIPNVDISSKAVYTNNLPAGAMRGFGVNQVTFAIENMINDLCEKGNFDPWDIRYKNALDQGLKTSSGQKLNKKIGLKECLEAVKADYKKEKHVGLACAIKNCGVGNGIPEISRVKLEVESNRIKLYHGWSEMGQGVDTVAQQMLCECLNIDDTSLIEVIVMTDKETHGGSTTASRGTFLLGKAVIDAGKKLKKDLNNQELKALNGNVYHGEYVCNWTTPPNFDGEMISHFAYSFAAHLIILSSDGKIKKIVAAHDSGKVVNKKLFQGQIEGGVVMGLGYALNENLKLDKGKIVDYKFKSLKLLRSDDVPEIKVISVEIPDIDAPFGAKGVGEISSIPTAAAVACAYRAFDGKKRYSLPVVPIKI